MLEFFTPLFQSLARALREESSPDTSHWDSMLDHPREFAPEAHDAFPPENMSLIVGTPVYFPLPNEECDHVNN